MSQSKISPNESGLAMTGYVTFYEAFNIDMDMNKKRTTGRGIKPVVIYTQSTGFWDYNIHKKLFQAYFRAEKAESADALCSP